MAGIAIGSWIGTLFFSARLVAGPVNARLLLGGGWVLLLLALSLSFAAQAGISRALGRIDETSAPARPDDVTAGAAGASVPWLIVAGLALIGFAVLI